MKTIYEARINETDLRIRLHYTGVAELQGMDGAYPFHLHTFANMVEAIKYVKALEAGHQKWQEESQVA